MDQDVEHTYISQTDFTAHSGIHATGFMIFIGVKNTVEEPQANDAALVQSNALHISNGGIIVWMMAESSISILLTTYLLLASCTLLALTKRIQSYAEAVYYQVHC